MKISPLLIGLVILTSGCLSVAQIKFCEQTEDDLVASGKECSCSAATSNPSNINQTISQEIESQCKCECIVDGKPRTFVIATPKDSQK